MRVFAWYRRLLWPLRGDQRERLFQRLPRSFRDLAWDDLARHVTRTERRER